MYIQCTCIAIENGLLPTYVDGTIRLVNGVLNGSSAYEVLSHVGTLNSPRLDDFEARLGAHIVYILLVALVSVEPVDFETLLQRLALLLGNNIALCLEEEAVALLVLLDFTTDIPVLGLEDILTKEDIGMVEAIMEESLKQGGMGVVSSPDLGRGDVVAVHAGEDEVVWAHEGSPLTE